MPETRVCVVGLRGIPGVMGGIESHCEQVFPRLTVPSRHYDITIIGRRPYVAGEPYGCGSCRRPSASMPRWRARERRHQDREHTTDRHGA